jgi:hypothetical protein
MARSIQQIRVAFPISNDCFELQKTIDKIINEKSFYAIKLNRTEMQRLDLRLAELNDYFSKKNCQILLGNKKLEQVSEIATKYQEVDKVRIEAENKPEVKKRIYIGIGIMLAGLGIILITNKD